LDAVASDNPLSLLALPNFGQDKRLTTIEADFFEF
jgi:hypothetical protein